MDRDQLLQHIRASEAQSASERLTARIFDRCWPGGPGDRSERAAIEWVRHWRPARTACAIPVCSCATGPCAVC